MSAEDLNAVRAQLVKLRREHAKKAAEFIKDGYANYFDKESVRVVQIQNSIEVIDKAIADEVQLSGPERSAYEGRGMRSV